MATRGRGTFFPIDTTGPANQQADAPSTAAPTARCVAQVWTSLDVDGAAVLPGKPTPSAAAAARMSCSDD